jgi:hypothetical protein
MTTLVDFVPSSTAPFQFQPTLNGVQYTALITWNVFGERYYLNLLDLENNLVASRALVPSGPTFRVSLTWNDNLATIVANAPHNIPIGGVVNVRILDSGTGYDGTFEAIAVDESTLTYALNINPNEPVAILGTMSFDLNLLAGYDLGLIVFHDDTQQFEF